MKPSVLKHGSVTLTPVGDDHLESIRQWRMDPEVARYMYTEPKISPEDRMDY